MSADCFLAQFCLLILNILESGNSSLYTTHSTSDCSTRGLQLMDCGISRYFKNRFARIKIFLSIYIFPGFEFYRTLHLLCRLLGIAFIFFFIQQYHVLFSLLNLVVNSFLLVYHTPLWDYFKMCLFNIQSIDI